MSVVKKFIGENGSFEWENVSQKSLDEEGISKVTKSILIGEFEKAPNSIMRFFFLEPGGHSRLERHLQEHETIVLTGSGIVQIGDQNFEVKQFDSVYIESNELHQFRNPSEKPFGFICVIPK